MAAAADCLAEIKGLEVHFEFIFSPLSIGKILLTHTDERFGFILAQIMLMPRLKKRV
jgi:hypothetical protein